MDDEYRTERAPFERSSEIVEAALVRSFKNGDERALGSMLDLYWDDLDRFANRILEDCDDSEDVVQEAFVRLWNGRSAWEREDSLRPVLYRIVRNLALNERRRSRNLERWIRRVELYGAPSVPTPLDEAEEGDMKVHVRRAVDSLPPRRRDVFLLVRYQQLSYRETAHALGVSTQTVANQMSLAMKDLRAALETCLGECLVRAFPCREPV